MSLASMTTTASVERSTGHDNRIVNEDDELSTWKRIVNMRVKESEALGITARLLNDHGNETVTGNIDTAMDKDDDMDAYIVIRQFLLQQLLLHHIGILIKSNATTVIDAADATGNIPTTHERITSWKILRDIFRTIDKAKRRIPSIGDNTGNILVENDITGTQVQHHHETVNETLDDNNAVRRPLSEMVLAD